MCEIYPLHDLLGTLHHPDKVKALIEAGHDVNAKNDSGDTSLHIASVWGLVNTVKLLVDNGADINIEDMFGRTPLCLAKFKGHTKVADLLKAAMKKQESGDE